jgi:hypothetical protein
MFVPPTMNVTLVPSSTLDIAGVTLYVGVRLVSSIVTTLLVASIVPPVLPERIEAVNVSEPSVVKSAVGVTEKDPTFEVMLNDPEAVPKSPAFESIVQKYVPLVIYVPLTLNNKLLPSFTLDAAGITLYVVGFILVSLIITEVLVASIVPLTLPERIEAVNVSAPSVIKSAVGVTEKDPLLLAILNDPELNPKSPAFESTVQ